MANQKPTIAIIRFPGTNREREAFKTSKLAGFTPFYFRWNDDFEELKKADAYILPGGFSYEDRSRSGIMCALDPVLKVIREEAKKGKPVLGICNGAQMLIESGMVPGGVENKSPLMCLARNVRKKDAEILGTGFINTWIKMKHNINPKRSAFTYMMSKDQIIHCPIAHGEGRYTTEEKGLVETLFDNQQIVFRYCDDNGNIDETYPTNPNGTTENIAAIINPEGNIMSVMPHFEHSYEIGKAIFDSMYQYVIDGNSLDNLEVPKCKKLDHTIYNKPEVYKSDAKNIEFFISLIITDNEAESVNGTLKRSGFEDAALERFVHFEMSHEIEKEELLDELAEIIRSGELLNTNKELVDVRIDDEFYHYESGKLVKTDKPVIENAYLVREVDDYIGEAKLQTLKHRLGFENITAIKRGIVWSINPIDKTDEIIQTRILNNPHSQKIFKFSK